MGHRPGGSKMLKVSSLRAIIVLIIDMYMTCILYYMDISRRAVQGGLQP